MVHFGEKSQEEGQSIPAVPFGIKISVSTILLSLSSVIAQMTPGFLFFKDNFSQTQKHGIMLI